MHTNQTKESMKKILIAEDTDSNFLLLSIILRKEYEIIRAYNGLEAVEMCRSELPDLILMDFKMPLMDGLQATREIRKFNKDIVVIALTANAYDSDREHAYDAGCNDYMSKPVAPNDERIRGVLEYIDGHLSEELSVEDLAEQVFLSKYHLMRKFKSEVGLSLHEYIAQRRLILARDLIARGETVTDACFQVGYRSYSSFFRAYVKLFGMTPTGKSEAVARESSYE